MFCPSCGNKLNEGAKFCNNCGVNIDEFRSNSNLDSQQNPAFDAQQTSFGNDNQSSDIDYPFASGANYQTSNNMQSSSNNNGSSSNNNQNINYAENPTNRPVDSVPPTHHVPTGEHVSVPKKKSGAKIAIISSLVTVFVILLAFGGWYLYDNGYFSSDDGDKLEAVSSSDSAADEVVDSSAASSEEVVETSALSDAEAESDSSQGGMFEDVNPATLNKSLVASVDDLISSKGMSSNVGVAVANLETGEYYLCNGYNSQYVAWGFYLPVYVALNYAYPYDYSTYKSDIMSSDISKCNSAGNFAMDCFGGPSGLTSYLRDEMGCASTIFGRKFGDTNSANDNFTTAYEAVAFMELLDSWDEGYKLCHSASQFGVSAPSGSTMYAQFGSENRNVKNQFNVFAIINGYESRYAIAILTRNGAGATGIVNELLTLVHSHMER
ncbi:MAG: zinc ribbon domain-containing protein [Clostridia bacterium]|nr:zinc ribbon domain-containing protein [Clostridia bacterium]